LFFDFFQAGARVKHVYVCLTSSFGLPRLIVVANQHKERPLPQDCRMSPVYSLITVLSHMCQEGDSARYMGQGQAWRTIASPIAHHNFLYVFF